MSLTQFSAFERAGRLKEIDHFNALLNAARGAHAKSIDSTYTNISMTRDAITFNLDLKEDALIDSSMNARFGKSVGALTTDMQHAVMGIQPVTEEDLKGLPENIRFMMLNAKQLRQQQGGGAEE